MRIKMMKKRHIPLMFAALMAVTAFFAACDLIGNSTDEPEDSADETYILFRNTGYYTVDVYSDSSRSNKETVVPAGGESKLEWAASPDGFSFYLSYQIPVGDDIIIPFNRRIGPYRIDEGKNITIPIENPASSPDPLTNKAYLLLYNETDTAGFRLERGTMIIKPEKIFNAGGSGTSASSLVNPRERAWYIISAGSASDYGITSNSERKPFPESVTEFEAGHWYTFRYADDILTLDADRPLNLESLLSRRMVTFDADGGSPAMQTRTVNSGSSIGAENMPSNPARSGYDFSGWYTGRNGGGTRFTGTDTVTTNITVYAWWSVRYTVTFSGNGGSPTTQTRTVISGNPIGVENMPEEPTRSGYGFDGWFTDTSPFTGTSPVTANMTVYAQWVVQYMVTFHADGGSPAEQTRLVNSGRAIGTENMPEEPAKSGYVFGGWYTGVNAGGTQFTGTTVVTNQRSVYAAWIPQYTVIFNSDGGSPPTQTRAVSSGSSIGVENMPEEPTQSGCVFGGWYTGVNGGGTQFTGTMPVTGNTTVYARWIPQYTLTFDSDGGVPATQTRTVNSGDSVGSGNMPSDPTRSGFGFDGWYTQQNGGGVLFTATTLVSGGLTVYAKWIPQYTVTFDADGGTPASRTRMVNSSSSLGTENMPDEPTRNGYTFDGWYTAKDGGGARLYATSAITEDITVYAKWIPQYTVTFDSAGGAPATQTRTVTSGTSLGAENMPNEPAKSEYNFEGWYTGQNGGGTQFTGTNIVTEDITVYAKWTIVQYTITFNPDGGTPPTQTRTVNSGDSVGSLNMPSDPAQSGYDFGGWYTEKNGGGTRFTGTITVTASITVYAKWTIKPMPEGLSLAEALPWLNTNAAEGGVYTITLSGNETSGPKTLSYGGKTVSITLLGETTERTVSLNSSGSLFTIGSGVTLTLGNNVTLRGRNGNTAPLVLVNSGVTLEMEAGSKISGNTSSSSIGGGGVLVYGGTFTMSGGTISDNTFSSSSNGGGGVYIYSGVFTMSGGTISGNTSSLGSSGGGVYVYGGTFTMSGGIISGNTSSLGNGGGVYVYGGTFTMSGGTITSNSANRGGGVYDSAGTFTKPSGGIIYGSNALDPASRNAASSDSYGHAVYVSSGSKKRNATAGEGIALRSAVSGSAGGWE
jgi:uncharacterized repeat protein (TIGR02543 family)